MKACILISLTLLAGACGGAEPPRAAAPEAPAPAARTGLQIKHTSVYVDDQERALRFYTEVLGLAEKDDVTKGPYRWLTVTAPGDEDGTELLLALDDNPAARAYQEALFREGQPAIMFYTDDVQRDYERIQARGGEFTMPPTEVPGYAIIAQLSDGCGNLIQITQLY